MRRARLTLLSPALLALGLPAATPSPDVVADGKTWLTVPGQSLEIVAGSALDFSRLIPAATPGSLGPIVPRGEQLVFSDGSAARFNCAMVNAAPLSRPEFPTHAEADRLAVQLRRHGYTLVRQQYVDFRLTRAATADVQIDPDQLDRFFYLLAALKKNGIAWALDIVSAQGKGVRGEGWGPVSPDDLRVRMTFDPAARALWLRLVDAVFARTNPYTGATTLADPALALVVGANENSFAFSATAAQPFPTGFDAVFDRWVRARSPSPAALARAVPDLTAAERSGAPIAVPSGWRAAGPRGALLRRFASEREVATQRWMGRMLAARGFRGPLLGANDTNAALDDQTRAALPIVDVHTYGGMIQFRSGGIFDLPSATTDEGLARWLEGPSARWFGKPITATEYDAPFPGRFRFEGGLLFPALAAMQGFQLICRTTNSPIELAVPAPAGVRPLRAYSGGLDPNLRAQETLATMLFARGDVSPAQASAALPFGAEQFARAGSGLLPLDVARAALLVRFGLVPPGAPLRPRTVAMRPMGESIAAFVARLRAGGALPPSNRTDPAAGVFQSATGEITLDQRAGRISVVTPRTEAASTTDAAQDVALGALRIASVDAPALVGATSLDGAPLSRSRRVLLVMTGDVRNTGMQLTDLGGQRSLFGDWGRLPMLMRRVRATLALRHDTGGPARLSVLSLRGTVLAGLDLAPGAPIDLDTAAQPEMPTTFFLLEYAR